MGSLLAVVAAGCVTERADGGTGNGSGEPSEIDDSWSTGAYVSALATDGSHVYFVSDGVRLARKAIGGGSEETLFELAAAQDAFALIVRLHVGPSDIVFVTDEYDIESGQSSRRLMALPKAGGTPKQLASSQDVRAFLGATVDSTHVYFSTFTSLLRVPIAGGTVQFVGESPNSVRYWAFSPVVVDTQLYWAELGAIYRVSATGIDQEGTLVTSVDGEARIISADPFVVTAGPSDYSGRAESFAVIDRATGTPGAEVGFGEQVDAAITAGDSVFAVSDTGLIRVPLAGGTPVHVTTTAATAIAATADDVFVGTATGITRVALD